jgi:phosphatidylserine decarboxylase
MSRLWHRFLGGLPRWGVIAVARALGDCRWRPLAQALIRGFCRGFRVDLTEARIPDPAGYTSFNDFFTRALRDGARPIAPGTRLACPCDGRIAAQGRITEGALLQAKGLDYRVQDLLGSSELAQAFEGGQYLTVYLAPRDYHRVHVPGHGRLRHLRRIPGRLHAVNATSAAVIPRLYVENERVVACFEGEGGTGTLALVLVAAIGVSGIRLTRPGFAPREVPAEGRHYPADEGPSYALGEEFGCFEMGSTVILLLGRDSPLELPIPGPGMVVRMGMTLA